MRIVVADDSVLIRQGVFAVLRDAGLDVVAEAGEPGAAAPGHGKSPTSPSSTSACRRPHGRGPPSRPRTTPIRPGRPFSYSPSTSSSTTPSNCSPEAPAPSATSSRTGYDHPELVDAVRSVAAGETWSTPRSSLLIAADASEIPSTSSPTANGTYWPSWPRAAPTQPAPAALHQPRRRDTPPPSSPSSGSHHPPTTTAGCWPSWGT